MRSGVCRAVLGMPEQMSARCVVVVVLLCVNLPFFPTGKFGGHGTSQGSVCGIMYSFPCGREGRVGEGEEVCVGMEGDGYC